MLSLIGYVTADRLAGLLPPRVCDAMAVGLARAVFALRPPARTRLEANLAALDPGAPRARVRRAACSAFEQFALSMADFLRLGRLDPEALDASVEIRGAQHLAAARASRRGVIVLSAHLGSWERGAAWLAARGARLHLVARPHPDPGVEAFFARRRGAWGVRTLPDRPLWLRASRALRCGEWVALMADRPRARPATAPRWRAASRRHPEGAICAWAASLSRRTGALILPAVMVRLPRGGYAACFEPPLSPERLRAGAFRDSLRGYLERFSDQWLAFEAMPEGLA